MIFLSFFALVVYGAFAHSWHCVVAGGILLVMDESIDWRRAWLARKTLVELDVNSKPKEESKP